MYIHNYIYSPRLHHRSLESEISTVSETRTVSAPYFVLSLSLSLHSPLQHIIQYYDRFLNNFNVGYTGTKL